MAVKKEGGIEGKLRGWRLIDMAVDGWGDLIFDARVASEH